MITALILQYYNLLYEFILEIDASNGVIASILLQLHSDGEWHPVAYFSKTMASTKCNYKIHNKEMLAIIRLLSQQRAELQGTPSRIKIYIDHKALEYFMSIKQLTSRQACWAEILSQFFFIIIYTPRKKNQKADALT